MIAGNVPKHLVVGARTGFLTAMRETKTNYQRAAMMVKMTANSVQLVDLGAAPMPVKSTTGREIQDMIEKQKLVEPEDWEIIVWISQNAIDDDQTGTLERKVRSAGQRFQRHIGKRVFEVLNAGDGTTYGLCYDGQEFFDSDHVDKGAHYQTNQDNEYALAFSPDNFETVKVAASKFVDDQGEYVEYQHDLIVCAPDLEREVWQVTEWREGSDTVNREGNPYAGKVGYITTPYFDSTAWHLVASNEEIKPIIVAMRKEPALQDAWFDPLQPDGGRHFFKFFARYEMFYGEWRLVCQGNT